MAARSKLKDQKLRLLRSLLWMTSKIVNYPCYTGKSIDRLRNLLAGEMLHAKDLQFVESCRRCSPLLSLSVALVGVVIIITYNFPAYKQLYLLDHINKSKNLHYFDSEPGGTGNKIEKLISIQCVLTNCTRSLTPGRSLAEDLIELPFARLCQPTLSKWLPPTLDSGRFACMTISILTYGHMLFLVMANLYSLVTPTEDLPLLFMFAPKTALTLFRNRLRAHLSDLSTSWLSTRTIWLDRLAKDKSRHLDDKASRSSRTSANQHTLMGADQLLVADYILESTTTAATTITTTSRDLGGYNLDKRRESERILYANYPHPNRHKQTQIERYIDDCLPSVRTDWWHEHSVTACWYIGLDIVMNYFVATLGTLVSYDAVVVPKRRILASLRHQMVENNCTIWRNTSSSVAELQLDTWVDLEQDFLLHWTPNSVVLYCLIVVAAIAGGMPMYCWFYLNWCEMTFWFDEITDQLNILESLIRVQRPFIEQNIGHNHGRKSKQDFYSNFELEQFRKAFREAYGNPVVPLVSRARFADIPGYGSKLALKISYESFVVKQMHQLKQPTEIDLILVEALEKSYVNLRAYIEHMDFYSRSLFSLGFLVPCGSYVAGLGTIVTTGGSKTFPEPFYVVSPMLCGLLVFICIGGGYHARATHMNKQLWLLVATCSCNKDMKVRHLGQLYARLTVLLDQQGGLSIKLIGSARISYINITQVGSTGLSRVN